MTQTIHIKEPTKEIVKSFAGVRGRVQAAVSAQTQSVTLSEALAQVKRFQEVTVTRESSGYKSEKPSSSSSGLIRVRTRNGTP